MIYIICPVRNITKEQKEEIDAYIRLLELSGESVFYPLRDAPQNDESGLKICKAEAAAIKKSRRIDIFWDVTSLGSHLNMGMAFIENKKMKLVKGYQKNGKGKSYLKVIKTKMRGIE